MKNIINIILLPAVFVWLICSVLLPLTHLYNTFIGGGDGLESFTLTIMSYSILVGLPLFGVKHVLETGFRIKSFKELITPKEKETKGCSSCKKKK